MFILKKVIYPQDYIDMNEDMTVNLAIIAELKGAVEYVKLLIKYKPQANYKEEILATFNKNDCWEMNEEDCKEFQYNSLPNDVVILLTFDKWFVCYKTFEGKTNEDEQLLLFEYTNNYISDTILRNHVNDFCNDLTLESLIDKVIYHGYLGLFETMPSKTTRDEYYRQAKMPNSEMRQLILTRIKELVKE